jgi:hypothetical protein
MNVILTDIVKLEHVDANKVGLEKIVVKKNVQVYVLVMGNVYYINLSIF